MLNQTSVIIGHRSSSKSRDSNLFYILEWLCGIDNIEIIVIEQDCQKKLDLDNFKRVRSIFSYNPGQYNRSWAFNIGAKNSDRNFLVFSDSDIFMKTEDFISSLSKLNSHDFVNPYQCLINLKGDVTSKLWLRIQTDLYGGRRKSVRCCGGMSMFARAAIEKIGLWDERFEGWGGEDDAQDRKIKTFGLSAFTGACDAYHMHHEKAVKNPKYYHATQLKLVDYASGVMQPPQPSAGSLDKYYIKNNVTFVTRMQNYHLYKQSTAMVPDTYQKLALRKTNCDDYFIRLIRETKTKWVVNVDEDCFITDLDCIFKMIEFMDCNGYDYSGMPDGGVCPHRYGNPLVQNAFFNVFNADLIRAELNSGDVKAAVFEESMKAHIPNHIIKHRFEFKTREPYYVFFYWLLKKEFKPLFIDSDTHEDGLTSFLKYENKRFCMHTWYARKYSSISERDAAQVQRIKQRISELGPITACGDKGVGGTNG